jgi:uncharacterized protein YecE (DUF72 family)
VTANHIYVRLHGSGPRYDGDYQTEHLKLWAKRIKNWKKKGHEIWFYFNNDWRGFAIENALELKAMSNGS